MLDEEYSPYWKTVAHSMLDGLMVLDPDGIILSIVSIRGEVKSSQ